MRSRGHAIATSVIAASLPLMGWLSTAVVALVCLRHGVASGSLVLLWTLLPVGIAFYYVGDPSPAMALLGTFMMAALLRQTLSWELVLIAAVVVSAVGSLIFELTAAGLLERFAGFYVEYLQRVDAALVVSLEEASTLLLGFFALGQAYAMLAMLVIARWWQSVLYNPGGFQKEFHGLRLSPALAAVIVVLMALCFAFSGVVGYLLPLLTVPLVFTALGLMHWLIARKELSGHWVAAMYACLVFLFQLVYPFLASLALMDSWFNIRNRFETIQKD